MGDGQRTHLEQHPGLSLALTPRFKSGKWRSVKVNKKPKAVEPRLNQILT
jgi:hypothetical protein